MRSNKDDRPHSSNRNQWSILLLIFILAKSEKLRLCINIMSKYDYYSSAIKITVPQYKESKIQGSAVFFVVEVSNKSNCWTLEKRFSEFDNLFKSLSANHHNIPKLPTKSFLFKMNEQDLQNRRKGLQQFLQALVCRNDLLNSEAAKQFLQLDKNASQSIVNPPRMAQEFVLDGNKKGVTDFAYAKEQELFFFATADMDPISRLSSYITNAKMPWEKEESKNKLLMEVGTVEVWRQIQGKYMKRWTKFYPTQAVKIDINTTADTVVIGLEDGILDILKANALNFEDIVCSKIHQKKITGVYLDTVLNLVYTISQDKYLKVSDARTLTQIMSILHKEQLVYMKADKANKRLFIGSKAGQIFIYDISNNLKLINTLFTRKKEMVSVIQFDTIRNYLFVGTQSGEITVFDLDKPGREKFAKSVAVLQGKEGITAIAWSSKRSELFVGTVDGSITFWNALQGKSIYVLQSSDVEISKLQYIQETSLLISANRNKCIKFWQVPKSWRDEIAWAQTSKKIQQERVERNKKKVKDAIQIMELDSDEDDLAGWHLD